MLCCCASQEPRSSDMEMPARKHSMRRLRGRAPTSPHPTAPRAPRGGGHQTAALHSTEPGETTAPHTDTLLREHGAQREGTGREGGGGDAPRVPSTPLMFPYKSQPLHPTRQALSAVRPDGGVGWHKAELNGCY